MSVTVAAPAVPFAPPALDSGEAAEVIATLESGWLSTGPRVAKFEAAFARYTGAPHAVAAQLVHRRPAPVAPRRWRWARRRGHHVAA